VSPFGQSIIDHLPFVGSIDAMNVSYRQRLLEISIQVIMEHPFFGAYDFFYSPAMQELKQGNEGFIDLVNTYAGVGLSCGLTGLSLFVGFFVAAAAGIYKRMRRLPDRDGEPYLLGRALLAVIVCIVVIIFTVSSILVVPVIYWSLAGVAVAYARMLALSAAPQSAAAGDPASAPQAAGLQPAYYKAR
jgi:O-antigen ligase